MLFQGHLPISGGSRFDCILARQSGTTTSSWITWVKPPGCSLIYIHMQAAGGGGGKGAGGAATVAPGGGGSGGTLRLLIPAVFLPDILYIRPGTGGAGATASGSGAIGITSYVSFAPSTLVAYLITNIAGGGGGGGAATNTAGSAGAIGAVRNMGQAAIFSNIAGQAGNAGSTTANAAPGSITPGASGIMVTGGGGGGNGTAAGAPINTAGFWPVIFGGAGTTGGNGAVGFNFNSRIDVLSNIGKLFPFLLSSGGTGGGGHTTGQAGNGGHGGYGSGGGGGGNSSGAGGTAGNGGNGGDGYIIIGAL